MQTLTPDTRLSDFHTALLRGQEALQEAGRILVSLLDEDISWKRRIREAHPEITEDMLETFERIGRKQLYYKLCLLEGPGVRALRRCPYSEQVKYAAEPVEMLLASAEDASDHLKVSIESLNLDQAKQVFASGRIRTLAEQRSFLDQQQRKPQVLAKPKGYTLGKGCVTFHEPVKLTAQDLARLLAEIA